MSEFQIANVLVALGGDTGNTVPRYRVTAAEIAVLQTIHGADAVIEIRPVGAVPANHRAERERLRRLYGRAKDGSNRAIVDSMFPGAAARVFERFDELQLNANHYKRGYAPDGIDEDKLDPQAAVDDADKAYIEALQGKSAAEDAEGGLDELDGDDEPIEEPTKAKRPRKTKEKSDTVAEPKPEAAAAGALS